MVYYNEIDPYAAEWLRNLIKAGHIANGEVDERSIQLVDSADLAGFTQCHFFAGIGVWSYALRLAGWPDDRPVWTGSCPCQPFSAAGKRGGFDDERHLWPEFFRLIRERRPPVVFGEQVASKDGLEWLDLVQADLERADYASAAVDICAAGVGAPHIRQRLYWVADRVGNSKSDRPKVRFNIHKQVRGQGFAEGRDSGWMAHANQEQRRRGPTGEGLFADRTPGGWQQGHGIAESDRATGWMANNNNNNNKGLERHGADQTQSGRIGEAGPATKTSESGGLADACDEGSSRAGRDAQYQSTFVQLGDRGGEESTPRPRPTNGHWRDADWVFCRDGKWRPVESGTFPLAHGATARVGRLRAYGNAIVPQVAQAFIEAFMECQP